MEQYLTIWDLLLTPIYLIALIAIAKRIRNKNYPVGHPLRPYYLPGLYAKFGGAIFIALIYQYYYGGGDTFNYFYHAQVINSSLSQSFNVWLNLLTHVSPEQDPHVYAYSSQLFWYNDLPAYSVSIITALFGLLNGTTYIPIALLFAFIAYTGIWAMFRTFVSIYPTLHKQLAIAFLFIPSTVVWGSAIFKDTICMFGLGWMTSCTFRMFINRDFSLKNIFLLALSFYLIAIIKIYILLAFLPALSLWLLLTYSLQIDAKGLRILFNLVFISIAAFSFFTLSQQFANELNRYSLDNITKTAQVTRSWIFYISGDEGSSYDLGAFDPTIGGMLSKFPQAVVVTFFRPFPWEVKKIIVGMSMLEASMFIYLTLKVIISRRKNLKLIFTNPNLIFFFIFSVIFGFAVGISSYNFGALSRYRIPCLPFYTALIIVLLNTSEKKSNNLALANH